MWGIILEKYDSKVKDALFESVYAMYSLKPGPSDSISN